MARHRPQPVRLPLRRLAVAGMALLLLAGCASPSRLAAVPSVSTIEAQTVIPNARFFPDRSDPAFLKEVLASSQREAAWLAKSGHTGPLAPVSYLSISGGGGDGAFGAGLLAGWTEAGTRPEFKLVTGVSTGALIAPFAFLGPRYDGVLKQTYTTVTDRDIFKKRNFSAVLFSDAMADTAPMGKLVDRYITQELLDEIAVEYAKGTLASAAIPGAFPPVMIDVTVGGVRYQEMHVDGGATRQVFMYPQNLHLGTTAAGVGVVRKRTLYIIRNSRLDPDWASVDRRLMSIVGRSVSSLIQTQGLGDLYRMYLTSTRDGLDYNLAYIPSDFRVPKKSDFDVAYMTPLFERGRQLAAAGYPWAKYPPGYDPNDALVAP